MTHLGSARDRGDLWARPGQSLRPRGSRRAPSKPVPTAKASRPSSSSPARSATAMVTVSGSPLSAASSAARSASTVGFFGVMRPAWTVVWSSSRRSLSGSWIVLSGRPTPTSRQVPGGGPSGQTSTLSGTASQPTNTHSSRRAGIALAETRRLELVDRLRLSLFPRAARRTDQPREVAASRHAQSGGALNGITQSPPISVVDSVPGVPPDGRDER